MSTTSSPRVLNVHKQAALDALSKPGGYPSLDEAAAAVAVAVIEAQGPTRWVVLTKHGTGVVAYGPYASADTARKVMESGLMVGTEAMLLAMQPVPRKGHR